MQTSATVPIELSRQQLHFEAPGSWKKLGLIALSTDLTSERDFARIIPPEKAAIYTSRVAFENPTTAENLRDMEPRLSRAADLLLPGETLDGVCYSCTAASVAIGDDAVTRAIQSVRPEVPVVTPAKAARRAFVAMKVSKIAMLTPYLVETSRLMANYFCDHGFELTDVECFGLEDDRMMARINAATIIEAACQIDSRDAEAIFISCTGLPAASVIAEIESRLGKAVVTSNQASSWAMMCLANLDHNPRNYGRLFDYQYPTGDA